MNSEIYTVDYFIKKFEAIPLDKWTTGTFGTLGDKHCALGHCGTGSMNIATLINQINYPTTELGSLTNLFSTYLRCAVTGVNDEGRNTENLVVYPQLTPKERILAALCDIKAKIESEKVLTPKEETVKEKVVYVTVDQAVRELQKKELCLQ